MTTEQSKAGIRVEGSVLIPSAILQTLVDGEWKTVSFAELVEHEIGYLLGSETGSNSQTITVNLLHIRTAVSDDLCQPVEEQE